MFQQQLHHVFALTDIPQSVCILFNLSVPLRGLYLPQPQVPSLLVPQPGKADLPMAITWDEVRESHSWWHAYN